MWSCSSFVAQKRHIFLIGFSGSGKSTVGVKLARWLKAKFFDTDTLIENRCGRTIERIFSDDGEAEFRKLESQVIIDLIKEDKPRMVVALGAGALQKRTNMDVVSRNGIIVHLSCSVREIYKRLQEKTDRPLLRVVPTKGETQQQAVMRRIKDLLNQRRQRYAQAGITISTTNRGVSETVRQLHRRIQSYNAGR